MKSRQYIYFQRISSWNMIRDRKYNERIKNKITFKSVLYKKALEQPINAQDKINR